jgi:hypothetical protein
VPAEAAVPGDGDRVASLQAPAATDVAESPMPLSTQSPADFPLADTGNTRQWPRSQLVAAGKAPALEAYLVRHNQMMAGDGLGGFVPYVDVVAGGAATDEAAATPTGAATPGEGRAP